MKFRQEFSSSASRAATQKDLALTCKHISWNELKPHRNISKHYDLMTCHVMWMFALKNRKGLTTQVIDQADQGPNFSPMLCSCCSLSTFSKSGKGMLCFCKWTWKIWKCIAMDEMTGSLARLHHSNANRFTSIYHVLSGHVDTEVTKQLQNHLIG